MSTTMRSIIDPGHGASVQLGGLGVVDKISGTETGGAFAIVEHPLAVGALAAPVHTHTREDEYSLVLEGQVGVRLGEEEMVAGPGSYILKPRGVPHTFWNAGDVPARLVEIISPAGFERFFGDMATVMSTWDPAAPQDFAALVALGAEYGLSFDLASTPDLLKRHGLRLG
jgi:quercetin dioxygenase-like cupin family protein